MCASKQSRESLERTRKVKARIERGEAVPLADVAEAATELRDTITTLRQHVGKRTPRA